MTNRKPVAKRHQCSVCNRDFARSEHLKRHITTHTNEKAFRCSCGKGFARPDLLKRHERIGNHLTNALASPESSVSNVNPCLTTDSRITLPPTPTSVYQGVSEDVASNVPNMLGETLYGDWMHSDAFQNFDAFISTMGLNAPFYNVLPDAFNDQDLAATIPAQAPVFSQPNWQAIPPEADPENVHELKRIPCLWTVNQKQRDNLATALEPYQQVLSGFVLPSALALGRYLTGYMEDFQGHQAILHTATYQPQESPNHPDLVLAICACGALTRYERQSAIKLFHASKAIIDVRWSRGDMASPESRGSSSREQVDNASTYRTLRVAQAAMLLSTFAIMEAKQGLVHDAASLHSVLVQYVRDHGAAVHSDSEGTSWHDWILEESGRRTQCAIFNILNMHTMALDSAPSLPSALLQVQLPCSTSEWTASSENDWLAARQNALGPVVFQQAYHALFDASTPYPHLISPLGNLVLISAILQRIWLARQLQLNSSSEALRDADLDEIEVALDRWTHAWKQAPESILDPRSIDASNAFTSTSYLGLAYVRLYTTYGARRRLCDWRPKLTGSMLHQAPWPKRSPRIESALLHAAQAFAIPVKFGIEYLGRKQFHRWDLQNFIWHLEAAIFLSKWFFNIAETYHYSPLSDFESRLISVVNNLVEKAEESIDPDLLSDLNRTRGQTPVDMATSLSRRVARLWACLYHKQNSPWGLVDIIGQSLAEYERLVSEERPYGRTAKCSI